LGKEKMLATKAEILKLIDVSFIKEIQYTS